MSRYIIVYSEQLRKAISVEFTTNKVLNVAAEPYQAIYFPASGVVYCSDKRYEEFLQLDSMEAKREFFQNRVHHYSPNELADIEEKAQRLTEIAQSLTTTINNHLK